MTFEDSLPRPYRVVAGKRTPIRAANRFADADHPIANRSAHDRTPCPAPNPCSDFRSSNASAKRGGCRHLLEFRRFPRKMPYNSASLTAVSSRSRYHVILHSYTGWLCLTQENILFYNRGTYNRLIHNQRNL